MTGQTQPSSLELNNVGFSYPDGRVALSGINLTVAPGERLVIVGPNGAGKSTLLMTLNGLNEPTGSLTVAGLSLIKENLPEIRRLVGLVFQDPDDQLFMPTVFEDVAFGPINMGLDEHEVIHAVEYALAMVSMGEFTDRLSHHLSFGEKKLISMATVLAMDPKILVMDEPSANLDPRAKRHLVGILKELPQTLIISTHDMNVAYELADSVAVIYKSKLVAIGPADRILTDEPSLLEYGLELPSKVSREPRAASRE
ncbi:MAG: ABC transporter ATP-binding protein [Actinomycetota bacterium]